MVSSPYVNKYFSRLDLMHLLDHHGVTGTVVGSIFSKLIQQDPLLVTSQPVRMDALNVEMQRFSDEHPPGSRLPKLTLSNLHVNGVSDLHGPMVKVANARNSTMFARYMADRFLLVITRTRNRSES